MTAWSNNLSLAVIGAGAMGRGIAQLFAQSGCQVLLFDAMPGVAQQACAAVVEQWQRLQQKGKLSEAQVAAAQARLQAVDDLSWIHKAAVVIEAIIEDLSVKRELLARLDAIVDEDCIIASNTSSLSISEIAAGSRFPQRVAGLHFFNPVPLMKVVEVIAAPRTAPSVLATLQQLVAHSGHRAVLAKDTPGFIVNHAGRAYVTEGLRILQENVCPPQDLDAIMVEAAGFKLGPCQLLDLTGLDVSLPVMESIYRQYYQEPRYRPSLLAARRYQAGLLGRKSGQGFYAYGVEAVEVETEAPPPAGPELEEFRGPLWLAAPPAAVADLPGLQEQINSRHQALRAWLQEWAAARGVELETGDRPSAQASILLLPLGEDVSTCAHKLGLDAARCLGLDCFLPNPARWSLMRSPAVARSRARQVQAWLAGTGKSVSLLEDSQGFVSQRILACMVNIACDMLQQGICNAEDLDLAVRLGLAYPHGPLAWGDALGVALIWQILHNLHTGSGDPRYRPSPWLQRRAQLGLSLSFSPD